MAEGGRIVLRDRMAVGFCIKQGRTSLNRLKNELVTNALILFMV